MTTTWCPLVTTELHGNKLEIGIRHNVDLDQLAAERASVTLSGSGDAKLAVSKALDVTLIGGAPAWRSNRREP